MALIDLVDIEKIYSLGSVRVPALRGISLSIEDGEFVSIMGPSGSGKSTLMNVIGCLDLPSSGKYRLSGEDMDGLSEPKLAKVRNKRVGFVFQSFNLLPRITAQANVELPLIYSGVSAKERRRRAEEMLKRMNLGHRLAHKPNALSGGERQRVAIARALVNDPDMILADEPTGNLDSKSGLEVMKILCDLNREGHTVILVTHEEDIAGYTRRRIRLKDGQVESEEQTDQ